MLLEGTLSARCGEGYNKTCWRAFKEHFQTFRKHFQGVSIFINDHTHPALRTHHCESVSTLFYMNAHIELLLLSLLLSWTSTKSNQWALFIKQPSSTLMAEGDCSPSFLLIGWSVGQLWGQRYTQEDGARGRISVIWFLNQITTTLRWKIFLS